MNDSIRQRAAGRVEPAHVRAGRGRRASSAATASAEHARLRRAGPFIWVSPRGTLEVLDDYPYWVAKQIGYFGDIETELVPAIPTAPRAQVRRRGPGGHVLPLARRLLPRHRGGHRPGLGLHMGAVDVFDFAVAGRGDGGPQGPRGQDDALGNAGWSSITDPMFAQAGVDITNIRYVEVGWPAWGPAAGRRQGDAALSWEGLRADWQGEGLEFDYCLGKEWSPFPANSFVIRRSDFEDAELKKLIETICAAGRWGWNSGTRTRGPPPRSP